MVSPSSSIYPSSPRSRLQSAFRGAFCASRTQVHLSCRRNTPLVLSSSRSSDNKSESKQNNTHMKAVASLASFAIRVGPSLQTGRGQSSEPEPSSTIVTQRRHHSSPARHPQHSSPAFVTSMHSHHLEMSSAGLCSLVLAVAAAAGGGNSPCMDAIAMASGSCTTIDAAVLANSCTDARCRSLSPRRACQLGEDGPLPTPSAAPGLGSQAPATAGAHPRGMPLASAALER